MSRAAMKARDTVSTKTTDLDQQMNFTLRKSSRALPCTATLAAALLLAACGTGSRLSTDGANDQLVFPAIESAQPAGGSYPFTEALRKLKPGMNKGQVAGLLGRPQFQEGFFGVREWDYVLNVTNDAGAPQMVCQLKAVFTAQDTARNFYRKCGDNVESLTDGKWLKYQPTVANVIVATPLTVESVETTADAPK
jgi:outer membrane protein assembly factor BamE (lipoprotein component of BamABCDE complex)